MKVHLLRSQELDIEKYLDVVNVLRQYDGPVQFIPGESEVMISTQLSRIWEKEDDFEKQMSYMPSSSGLFESKEAGWLSWITSDNRYAKERLKGDIEKLESFYLA